MTPVQLGPEAAALSSLGLGKRYKRNGPWVIKDIDVSIRRGSITALVGPNGAGKSTLIRCWLGFVRPTRGAALVGPHDSSKSPELALSDVGYVPQGFAFYQALTVAEHIDYAQSWRRRFDRKFVEARLRDLRIPLSQRATTLSGGQQAQLSLAIALGSRASVLILDEPLAALDPLARREFMQNLRDVVRAEGRTALLSSHVVADVQHVCERIIILSEATIRLDLQVSEALATHRLISEANDDSRVAGKAIAQIPSFAGAPVTLVLGRPSTVHEQPSLEEIVMGYLAASRTTAELPKHIRAGS